MGQIGIKLYSLGTEKTYIHEEVKLLGTYSIIIGIYTKRYC